MTPTLSQDSNDHNISAPLEDRLPRQANHSPDSSSADPDRVLAEAEQAGIDVMGLKRNLELSPDERLDQFLKALAWLEWATQVS